MTTISGSEPHSAAAIQIVNRKANVGGNVSGTVPNAGLSARNRPEPLNRSVSNAATKRGRSPSPPNGFARKKIGGNVLRGLITNDKNCYKRRILITNIVYDAEWSELKEFIKSKIQEDCFVKVFPSEIGKSRGLAVAEFKSDDIVPRAVATLNQQEFKGRPLNVREETAESRDEFGHPVKLDQNNQPIKENGPANGAVRPGFGGGPNSVVRTGSTGRDAGFGPSGSMQAGPMTPKDTFGISVPLLQDLGIQLPLSRRAYVANLDYKTSEKDIVFAFSLAGKVLDVEFLKDVEGQSKGQCIIEYSHPVEAVQAVSMFRGAFFNGRQMSVRVDARKLNDRQYQVPFPTVENMPTTITGLGAGLGEHGKPLDYADQLMDILVGYRPAHMAHMEQQQQQAVQQQQQQLQQQQVAQQQQQQQNMAGMSMMGGNGAVLLSPMGGGMMMNQSPYGMGASGNGMQANVGQQQQQQPMSMQSGMGQMGQSMQPSMVAAVAPMSMHASQTPAGMVVMGTPNGGIQQQQQPQGQMMMNHPHQMMPVMASTPSSNNMQPSSMTLLMQGGQPIGMQSQQQQHANQMQQMQNAMSQPQQQYISQNASQQYGAGDMSGLMTPVSNSQMMGGGGLMPISNGVYSQGSGGGSQGQNINGVQQQSNNMADASGSWAVGGGASAYDGSGAVQMSMHPSMMGGGMDMNAGGAGGGMMMMQQPHMGGGGNDMQQQQQQQQQQPNRQFGGGFGNQRMGSSQDMNLLVTNVPPGVEWQEVREHFNRVTGLKGIRAVEKKHDAEGIFLVKYFERDAFLKAQQTTSKTSMHGRLIDVTLAPPGFR